MKLFRLCLLLLCCFVAVSARADTPEEVSFCRFPSLLSIIPTIAEKQGFFEQVGLKVEFHEVVNGKICQDELVADRVDFAIFGDGPFAYLSASKHPLKVLAVVEEGRGVSIVARRDSGIENFADLKGKRLTFLPGTISSIFVWKLLEDLGWSRQDLKLSPLQPPAMVQAIAGRQVDAMAIWDPWLANARDLLGLNAVYLSGAERYRYHDFLVTHQDTLAERREAAQRVLKALQLAEAFIKAHPREAQAVVGPYLKMSPQLLTEVWPKFKAEVGFPSDTMQLLSDAFLLIKKFDAGFADKPLPDFETAFDRSVFAEIQGGSVPAGKTLPEHP